LGRGRGKKGYSKQQKAGRGVGECRVQITERQNKKGPHGRRQTKLKGEEGKQGGGQGHNVPPKKKKPERKRGHIDEAGNETWSGWNKTTFKKLRGIHGREKNNARVVRPERKTGKRMKQPLERNWAHIESSKSRKTGPKNIDKTAKCIEREKDPFKPTEKLGQIT